MASKSKPGTPLHPLFDTAPRLKDALYSLDDYPTLKAYLSALPSAEAVQDWRTAAHFLTEYAATTATYSRFRGEVQRFLLYLWNISQRSLRECTSDDINGYFQFLKKPDPEWIGSHSLHSFRSDSDGYRVATLGWRPFISKGKEYRIQGATLDSASRALHIFIRTLVMRNYIARDPMIGVRKAVLKADLGELDQVSNNADGDGEDDGDTTAPRLTDWQWGYLKESLLEACEQDDQYERHLFVVITMKTLYLRVSELAPQSNQMTGKAFAPTMGDFRNKILDGERYWHLRVLGKGTKIRYIPLPAGYMDYLKRFRLWRGLPPLPEKREQTPMIPRKSGSGQAGKRSIERIVKEAYLLAAERMKTEGLNAEARELEQIADHTHYLRHTGASMDIHAGRPIRHVSEDLGHESVAFTEAVYISADSTDRYLTGLNRRV